MSHQIPQNCWSGPDAIAEFLHPRNAAPLIKLPPKLNPYHADGVDIYAKIFSNPHSKLAPAIEMMDAAQKAGKLAGVHTIVEASSGNMAHALDLIKGRYGIKNFVAILPRDLAPGKFEVARLSHAELYFRYGDSIAFARKLGKQDGWYNPDQYSNPANPEAHKKWTGPQILEQTGGDITIFCAALGTTATMEGTAGCLWEKLGRDNVTTVGAICTRDSEVPGVRDEEGLKAIGFNWRSWSDHIQPVTAKAAFIASRKMSLLGLQAGPSSGLALRGLLNFLNGEKEARRLDGYRKTSGNNAGRVVAVFICPDPLTPYFEKVSLYHKAKELHPDQDAILA